MAYSDTRDAEAGDSNPLDATTSSLSAFRPRPSVYARQGADLEVEVLCRGGNLRRAGTTSSGCVAVVVANDVPKHLSSTDADVPGIPLCFIQTPLVEPPGGGAG